MQQPRKQRESWQCKRKMKSDKKLHRINREKENRKRYARPADLGRTLCFRGNRVCVMSQDINQFPDKELGICIFAYLFQGVDHWNFKWARVNDMEKFGRWVLARFGNSRLDNPSPFVCAR